MKPIDASIWLRVLYKLTIIFFKSFFEAFTQIVWGILGLTLFMNIPTVDIPSEALTTLKELTLTIINNWGFFLVILFFFSAYTNFKELRREIKPKRKHR